MLNVIENVSALALERSEPFTVELVDVGPADPLMADRDAAAAKLAKLSKFDDAINRADQARQAAHEKLREFLNAERAALLAWAESPDVRDPPLRDVEAHSKLVAAAEDADRQHDAAVRARATIEPSVARARAVLNDIQIKIDARIAKSVADDALLLCEEINAILGDVTIKYANVLSARQALYQRAESLRDARQLERSGTWGHAAGQLANIGHELAVRPTQSDIQAHMPHWIARINGGTS